MATKDVFAHRKPKLVTKPFVAVDKPKRGRSAKSAPLKMDLSSVKLGPKPEPAKVDSITAVLTQRGSRYGSFDDNARIAQELKVAMRSGASWGALSDAQKEGLEMVQHKIARMVNGDPTYMDNVIDILGYTTLFKNSMEASDAEGKVD